jgi:heme/copper-type cytochrome/quinol oxidase subunit 3
MKQRALVTFAAVMLTTAALAAQPAAPPPPPVPAAPGAVALYQPPVDANTTREQLQEILRQYPPSVGEVLRRDTSLLARPDYIAPYPQLVAFLQQHPEVARNPSFFFGGYDYYERREPLSPEVEALGVLLGGLGGFLGFGAFFAILIWLVRAVIQHRRWLRQSKVQTEVHTKLMDRMNTNEELLAYIQSPAGRRFLESAPIQQESDSPRVGAAPVGPIIWSMMAGIVLGTVGVGFRFAANSVSNEAQQAFTVVGVILLALGAGFVIASVMAYLVSSRLGLFPVRAAVPDASSGNA